MVFQGIANKLFNNTWMLKSSPLLSGPVSASWFLSDLHFFAQRLAHFVSSNEQFCMHGQFHLLPLILAMVSAVSQGWKWYFNHGTSWYFSHFNVFSSYFNDISKNKNSSPWSGRCSPFHCFQVWQCPRFSSTFDDFFCTSIPFFYPKENWCQAHKFWWWLCKPEKLYSLGEKHPFWFW